MNYDHEDDQKEDIPKEACKTCRFYQPIGHKGDIPYGECRKHAPQVAISGSQWPKVADYAWCGEWKPNE